MNLMRQSLLLCSSKTQSCANKFIENWISLTMRIKYFLQLHHRICQFKIPKINNIFNVNSFLNMWGQILLFFVGKMSKKYQNR